MRPKGPNTALWVVRCNLLLPFGKTRLFSKRTNMFTKWLWFFHLKDPFAPVASWSGHLTRWHEVMGSIPMKVIQKCEGGRGCRLGLSCGSYPPHALVFSPIWKKSFFPNGRNISQRGFKSSEGHFKNVNGAPWVQTRLIRGSNAPRDLVIPFKMHFHMSWKCILHQKCILTQCESAYLHLDRTYNLVSTGQVTWPTCNRGKRTLQMK